MSQTSPQITPISTSDSDASSSSLPYWKMCATPAGVIKRPPDLEKSVDSDWTDAKVPGTVAETLTSAGKFNPHNPTPLGSHDYWYRITLPGTGRRLIRLRGLATVAEVWLGDTQLLRSTNMFVEHELSVSLAPENGDLYICFRSLENYLKSCKSSGRARWRTRLVDVPALRTIRTTLLGHMRGWFPSIEPIGPWRAIDIADPKAGTKIWHHQLRSWLTGKDGHIEVKLRLTAPLDTTVEARLRCGEEETPFVRQDAQTLYAKLKIYDAKLWWPHTHGVPTLYDVVAYIDEMAVSIGRTGFRTVTVEKGPLGHDFSLAINATAIFARGACWSSLNPLTLNASREAYRNSLSLAKEAGLNMIRVSGTMTYEDDAFYSICDELGLLVWQDFMFANFDYPSDDPDFVESVENEAAQFLSRCSPSPSLAVLCGGSEIAQQASMAGLSELNRIVKLTDDTLAHIVEKHRPDVIYISDTPKGDALPFYPRNGVSHYYGVGAYLRHLDDARRSDVRFASECLAFANVPCDATLQAMAYAPTHDPRWKAGVPRDPGAPWDFEDVRDHYLCELYSVNPARLRTEDPSRYLELSRSVVADIVSDTFAEWRHVGSKCAGALVWQFQDVVIGAGWGVVDALQRPKSPWYAMKHSLQPKQILLVDEGLNGLDVHLLNETPYSLDARVELVALRAGHIAIAHASRDVYLRAQGGERISSSDLLGHFFDFNYAYRFGTREHDTVIASLYTPDGNLLSQAFYFPNRTASDIFERSDIGLSAEPDFSDGQWWLNIKTFRVARYVQISCPGWLPDDDWFHLAPGTTKRVALTRASKAMEKSTFHSGYFDVHGDDNLGTMIATVSAVNSRQTIHVKGTRSEKQ